MHYCLRKTAKENPGACNFKCVAGNDNLPFERRDSMNCERSCGNPCNICIEVLVAVVAATVVGLLFGFGLIPNIVTALWVMFGFAVLNLIFLVVGLYGASLVRRSLLGRCLCCNGTILLVSIIATIILAIVALSISLVAPTIGVIVLIAVAAFFAALMAIEFISLLVCLINGLCCWRED